MINQRNLRLRWIRDKQNNGKNRKNAKQKIKNPSATALGE